ncbi:MAG: ATP-binding protein, partial [Firmicutes bacterium]|nr:ATP-binding protein [Bacillota bacterium]
MTISLSVALVFTRQHMDTVRADLYSIVTMADNLMTLEINRLIHQNKMLAAQVANVPDERLNDVLATLEYDDEVLGLAIFGRDGLMAFCCAEHALPGDLISPWVQKALNGSAAISTTTFHPRTRQVTMHVCVPMENGRAFDVTISGLHFANILQNIRVWNTGSIFVLDHEGTLLSDNRPEFVTERLNFIKMGKNDPNYESSGAFYAKMLREGKSGSGVYTLYGADRLCAYRPITGSDDGWMIGAVALLDENPVARIQTAVFLSSGSFLLLGILAAVFFSSAIARPFEKITEQNVRLEELQEEANMALEAKSRFLANMSHEMRTPLNEVIGLSELILIDDESLRYGRENLQKISNAGCTLLSIVNDILDISKIESGNFTLMPVEYDMASLLNDTITLYSIRKGEKPIAFHLDITEDLPSRVLGDDLRVKQILNNLLSNAFKYTREGNVTLRVRHTISCDADVWLDITVVDTGIGIRKEDLPQLFSDYAQVDVNAHRKIAGTGLGLAITRSLVLAMEGDIAVESEYGKGSTFRVRIRQGYVSKAVLTSAMAENLRTFRYIDTRRSVGDKIIRPDMSYARVLVVDDMQTNLDVAIGMMHSYKMQVDGVTSGTCAIERIARGTPVYDAIFMDHMMPELDGVQAIQAIRAIHTEYAKTIPIIALTANAIAGNEQMFLSFGFQAFLSKPIDILQLDAVIRRWIRNKSREALLSPDDEPLSRLSPKRDKAPAPIPSFAMPGV